MLVVGVDGCRDGWIVVALNAGRFAGASKYATFRDLAEATGDALVVGVDMPIGLLPDSERLCDRMAREHVGPRRNSVFLVPPRPAIEATSFEEANRLSQALTGKGVSVQLYHLRDKILEVDAVVRSAPPGERPSQPRGSDPHPAQRIKEKKENRASLLRYARIVGRDHGATKKPVLLGPGAPGGRRRRSGPFPGGRFVEVHPEASFRELAGRPLEHGKKSYNGLMQRIRLLEKAGIVVPELDAIGGVAADDVLDAAAVAWTAARYARGEARSLPPMEAWQHDGDRPVAIWI